jgi:hypothetical protein
MDDDFEEEKGWGGDTPDGDVSCSFIPYQLCTIDDL